MTVAEAVLLGIAQGLTEFLPISSDGHLALVYHFLGDHPDLTFEVFLHAATLIAMFVYFRTDVARLLRALFKPERDRGVNLDRRLILLIVIGNVATGIVALLLEPVVEPMAARPAWVAIWFLGTSLALFAGEALSSRVASVPAPERLTTRGTLFIGLMQGLAVLPGLSRSGSTIAAGMLSGLSRESAARFSFLLGMPIITAAALKDLVGLVLGHTQLPPLPVSVAGFVAAGVSGYLAVAVLLRLVRTTRLYGFAIYTAVLGCILLATTLL